ncbi:MAG: nucleoside recognition protein [Candidatus Delongbacteria bacterium]|nr:nucleoside recognition protein [Candidatus Delongbacteria bacterium]
MLNYIWMGLMAIAVIVGAFTGRLPEVTEAAFNMAALGVTIALDLIGIMALWLGMMRLAEKAGVIRWLAWLIRPIMKRLFPEIPSDHPAIGSMLMNISASWLGLGNAATPLGLKAMEELQELNPEKETASNSQVLFLAINTASITLVPTTIIAVRIAAGSAAPLEIIGTTIFASGCATVVAILAAKLYARLPWFRARQLGEEVNNGAA